MEKKKKDIPPKPKAQAPETGKIASPPQSEPKDCMTADDVKERGKLALHVLDCLTKIDEINGEAERSKAYHKSRLGVVEDDMAKTREKIRSIEHPKPIIALINKSINAEKAEAKKGEGAKGLTSVKDAIKKAKAKEKKDKPAKAKKEPKKA